MNCPRCDSSDTKVLDSREKDNIVSRRRVCIKCRERFSTKEAINYVPENDLALVAESALKIKVLADKIIKLYYK